MAAAVLFGFALTQRNLKVPKVSEKSTSCIISLQAHSYSSMASRSLTTAALRTRSSTTNKTAYFSAGESS